MATPEKKPFSFVNLAIDMVACVAFFVFFFVVLQPHVPSEDPSMIRVWSAAASSCMTGVFWLALQMVKTVYRFQRDSRR